MKSKNESYNKRSRVVALLTRDELDFIDRLSKDALFSTGHKLTRTDIISAIIDVVKGKGINAEGVHSKPELESRLLSLMKVVVSCTHHDLKGKRQRYETP